MSAGLLGVSPHHVVQTAGPAATNQKTPWLWTEELDAVDGLSLLIPFSYLSSSLRQRMMNWVTGSSSFPIETERLALFSQS